jgi:trehalose 6-phosphate phosphatase
MIYGLSILPEIDAMLRRSRRVLIASDFDGTLCPIAETPADVSLAPGTLTMIHNAMACERLKLAVISGRALADVAQRLPAGIIFAGNHGLEITGCGIRFEHDEAKQLRSQIAAACEYLREAASDWPGALVEDKGLSATLHFRRVDRRLHSLLLFTARRTLGSLGPKIALRIGNCALEIRPRVPWDKGAALGYIHEQAGPFDSCICLGDDRTDESMFRAECSRLSIRVGHTVTTSATHYLSDPADVAILLSHVIAVCKAEEDSTPAKFVAAAQAIATSDTLCTS